MTSHRNKAAHHPAPARLKNAAVSPQGSGDLASERGAQSGAEADGEPLKSRSGTPKGCGASGWTVSLLAV